MINRDDAKDMGLGGPRGCFVASGIMLVIVAIIAAAIMVWS